MPRRTDKKTRLYSMNDLKKLRLIKLLTQKRGLNLAGVKMILEMIDDIDRALREFEEELENLL
ncbi:MAG: hypothetical protein DRQ06_05630 [Candidatus Hydrothermota bacterium]|nr:MAG: hypothetical protein DRQ06_05630 [Candidatus Hydrothermae bacterium]